MTFYLLFLSGPGALVPSFRPLQTVKFPTKFYIHENYVNSSMLNMHIKSRHPDNEK